MLSNKPTPYSLWVEAGGDTPEYDRDKYLDLMRKHGLIVPTKEGDDPNLPCGWPGKSHRD